MSTSLLLSGTAEELKSPRALKLLVTAGVGCIPVQCAVVESAEELRKETTALASSLALTVGGSTHVAGSIAMMRTIARLAPGANLLGTNYVDQAIVDGWLEFIWSAVDLMVESSDLQSPLSILDANLRDTPYLVGDSVTIADLSLVSSLCMSEVDLSGWDNLSRHYEAVFQFPAFQEALKAVRP